MPYPLDHAGRDGWSLEFDRYVPDQEQWREVVLALGNGVWVQRAAASCAPRGDCHYPGTYHAGLYDDLLSTIEGEPDPTESLPNLPDATRLSVQIEGGPWLDLDAVTLLDYRHGVSFKRGVSWREFRWVDAEGRRTRWRERRLLSLAEPERGALLVRITAENWRGRLRVRSGIDGAVRNTNVERYRAHESRHIELHHWHSPAPRTLVVSGGTRRSGQRFALGERLDIHGAPVETGAYREEGGEHVAVQTCQIERGQSLTVSKSLALAAGTAPLAELQRKVTGCLADAPDFRTLYRRHWRAWRELWQVADVRADHAATQLALRFHIFHLLQTLSPHSAALDTGVPARGWHGEGYRGHIFWDELFVLPFIFYRLPELGRALLLYRYRRLDQARAAARAAGLRGAMFPWRSAASGREVTPRKQLNLLSGHFLDDPTYRQRHIGSAVVFNVWHYYLVTGDEAFLAHYGAEMILEIARFWASCARWNAATERYDITGVLGPDEHHTTYPDRDTPGLDNNAYTNLMAAWTLCRGLEVLERLAPRRRAELCRQLGLERAELAGWDRVSRRLTLDIRADGIINQFQGFDRLAPLPAEEDLPEGAGDQRLDWVLEAAGDSIERYQVVKQADTLVALYLLSRPEFEALLTHLGYDPTQVNLRRTARYYRDITVHGSSLSQIVYAGALARLDLGQSWECYRDSLATDLETLSGESGVDGVHLGAMGGTLDVLQRCYLGIHPTPRGLEIRPALPPALDRLGLRLCYRGQWLELEYDRQRLSLRAGDKPITLALIIQGELVELVPRQCLTVTLPPT